MEREVRVRFAPSPTGPLHIGGVRTALYNFLFARHHGGKFLLRIEDTDQARKVEGTEEYIGETLEWLGLKPDEGPANPGSGGPYRQSERREIYMEHVDHLLRSGKAYIAFDTPGEIEEEKTRMKEAGAVMPQYDSLMRLRMKNSLTLEPAEVEERINAGDPYVVRIRMPEKKEIRFEDMIRGWVVIHSSTLDDKVLLKSDGMPTYHLANVVDDHLMGISHVIRGEEWLPSAPLHIYLYQCLGWSDTMPRFAHLPLILKPDGKGKLSKRDSEKHGIPVFPIEWKDPLTGDLSIGFREEGYLPEALINFLAFLGWNPGDERELFELDELVAEFSLERIIKGGARFDVEKARWYNEQYLKASRPEFLARVVLEEANMSGIDCTNEQAARVAELMKERVSFPRDLLLKAMYLFEAPLAYDEKVVRKKWNSETASAFSGLAANLEKYDNIEPDEVRSSLESVLEPREIPMGKVMQALRVAVTGEAGGPDLMEIIAFIGPKETAQRIIKAIRELPVND